MGLTLGSGFVHAREIMIDDELFATAVATERSHFGRDRHGRFLSELTFLDCLRSHGEILSTAASLLERFPSDEYKAKMMACPCYGTSS